MIVSNWSIESFPLSQKVFFEQIDDIKHTLFQGIDAGKAALLISAIGVLNTVIRILMGFLADFPQINPLLVNNICLAVAAVSVGIAPFCHTYIAYMAMSSFFATAIGKFIISNLIIHVFTHWSC